jgi:hypothetical protein
MMELDPLFWERVPLKTISFGATVCAVVAAALGNEKF